MEEASILPGHGQGRVSRRWRTLSATSMLGFAALLWLPAWRAHSAVPEAASPAASARPPTAAASLQKSGEHFKVTLRVEPMPPAVGVLYSWTANVDTRSGERAKNARVSVSGGMPGHGHGLPTAPRVTQKEPGVFLIEGVKFSMPGLWVFDVAVSTPSAREVIRFDLVL